MVEKIGVKRSKSSEWKGRKVRSGLLISLKIIIFVQKSLYAE